MSEAKEAAEKPKGKGKMPMMVGMALMLAAGGFFGMKMKGGGNEKKVKPEVKISAEKSVDLKEVLVNLHDAGAYCRAEVSFQLAEGYDAKKIEDHNAAVRDAIITSISSKSLAQLQPLDNIRALKREIAAKVNAVLDETDPEKIKAKEADAKDSKKDKDSKDSKDAKDSKDSKKDDVPEHPDWDSDTGPVLKVYFSSFATQQ